MNSDHVNHVVVLGLLVRGIDPQTGEILPAGSVLCQPEVSEALHFVLDRIIAGRTNTEAANVATGEGRPARAGTAWLPEEEVDLLSNYDDDMSPRELAQKRARTRGAIASWLVKL
jgi:hypothetical protein